MATGGRVLHHLAQRLPDPRNLIVFVGYQSAGTLGQLIRDGRNPVIIHKLPVPVRAQVVAFEQFSDHADYQEVITWLRGCPRAPRCVFLVHGEPDAAAALKQHIEDALHWNVHVAQWLEEVELD
jgi:metallo-beta-lactamase family protein